MRIGWIGSPLVHLALIAPLLLSVPQCARELPSVSGAVVPIEVVTFAEFSNIRAIATIAPPGPIDQPEEEGAPKANSPPPDSDLVPDAPAKPPPKPEPRASPDLNKLQDLIDRSKKNAGQTQKQSATTAARGANPRQGAGLQNELSANEMDYLAAKFRNCWRDTRDAADPERLRVVVRIELKRNGALKGDPIVIFPPFIPPGDAALHAAARNAVNAVRICAPFNEFSPERYAYWRAFDLDMHSNGLIE